MLDLFLSIALGLAMLGSAYLLMSVVVVAIGLPEEDEDEDDTDIYTPRSCDVSTHTNTAMSTKDKQPRN